MAYVTTNPPRCLVSPPGGGPQWWSYDSADAALVVRVINYFTNALDLGMKVGDIVFHSDSVGGTVAHIYTVSAVIAAGADLSDGVAIVATNTD